MNYVVSLFTCSPRSLRLRVFALAYAFLLFPLVLSADTYGDYTYTVSGGKATITLALFPKGEGLVQHFPTLRKIRITH